MNIFVWGFCGPIFDIVEEIGKNPSFEVFSVSDAPSNQLNIFDAFNRKMPASSITANIATSSAEFSVFKELYSRHWYPENISDEDYREYFKYYINYFGALFEQKNFRYVVFSSIPHEGPDYLIFLIAKQLGVKTLVFYQSIFENRVFVSDNTDVFSKSIVSKFGLTPTDNSEAELESGVDQAIASIGNWFYLDATQSKNKFSLIKLLKNSRRHFKKSIKLMLRLLKNDYFFLREYNKYVNSDTQWDFEFVYFPLHLQPELTTSILGNGFTNQILAIDHLSKLLPKNIKILVKENPKQNAFKRPVNFYEKLCNIPGVILVPVQHDSIDLIKKSLAVATITGTVGWESINLGKPVLTYGTCWFRELPGVYKYDEVQRFENILSNPSTKADVKNRTIDFLSSCSIEGNVDYDYCLTSKNFDLKENTQLLSKFIIKFMEKN